MRPTRINAHRLSVAFVVVLTLVLAPLSGLGMAEEGNSAAWQQAASPGEDSAAVSPSTVVLFTSGVGYFQHETTVTGNETVTLTLPTDSMNDLLKSLVLRDLDGGTIRMVTYPSQDPLERTLGGFSIDLAGNPSLTSILVQARGEAVNIQSDVAVTGNLLGVESRPRPGTPDVKEEVITVLTTDGIRSVRLDAIQSISFLRPELQREFQRALATIAENRNDRTRTVRLACNGEGTRRIQMGYVRETPVWKTSYRLVLREGVEPFLQGWAIVENTTDNDWENVHLSLVAGQPISFRMNLYQPHYVTRPEVSLSSGTGVTPQLYDEAISRARASQKAEAPRAMAPSMQSFAESGAAAFDSESSVQTAAQAIEAGQFFRYVIDRPVSIPRHEAALVPISQGSIGAERVSVYDARVLEKHPLAGISLSNTTGLHLMGGPITVYEDGIYGGDARIEDLRPGAKRLISYAVDLDTEVDTQSQSMPEQVVSVKISKGTMITTRSLRRKTLYRVAYRGSSPRTLLIEHPADSNWTLAQPEQPAEETRNSYRFEMKLTPGKELQELPVVETRQLSQSVALTNLDSDRILFFTRQDYVPDRIRNALSRVVQLRRALDDVTAQRKSTETRIQDIYREQERIRANMEVLEHGGDLYQRYQQRLASQEDQLTELQKQLQMLRDEEQQKKSALENYITSLEL